MKWQKESPHTEDSIAFWNIWKERLSLRTVVPGADSNTFQCVSHSHNVSRSLVVISLIMVPLPTSIGTFFLFALCKNYRQFPKPFILRLENPIIIQTLSICISRAVNANKRFFFVQVKNIYNGQTDKTVIRFAIICAEACSDARNINYNFLSGYSKLECL